MVCMMMGSWIGKDGPYGYKRHNNGPAINCQLPINKEDPHGRRIPEVRIISLSAGLYASRPQLQANLLIRGLLVQGSRQWLRATGSQTPGRMQAPSRRFDPVEFGSGAG